MVADVQNMLCILFMTTVLLLSYGCYVCSFDRLCCFELLLCDAMYLLFVQDDQRMLQDIQRFYNTVIEELPANVADLI